MSVLVTRSTAQNTNSYALLDIQCRGKYCISLHQSTRTFFWAVVKLCGFQREQIFFTARCSCNIECIPVEEMSKELIMQDRHATYREIISSRTALTLSGTTAVFVGPSRNSSYSELQLRLNSLNQIQAVLQPNKDLSSSMQSCREHLRRKM